MKPTRIVLALALAAVAAPALSQADEDKGLSSGALAVLLMAPPAAPAGLTTAPSAPASPSKSGSGNGWISSGFGNDFVKRQGGLSAGALPQQRGDVPSSGAVAKYHIENAWPKSGTVRPLASAPVAPSKGSQPATQPMNAAAIQQHGLPGAAARR